MKEVKAVDSVQQYLIGSCGRCGSALLQKFASDQSLCLECAHGLQPDVAKPNCFHCGGELRAVTGQLGDVHGENAGKFVCANCIPIYQFGPLEFLADPHTNRCANCGQSLSMIAEGGAPCPCQPKSAKAMISRCCNVAAFEAEGRAICGQCRLGCRLQE